MAETEGTADAILEEYGRKLAEEDGWQGAWASPITVK